ncbi:MAG: SDR family NAD(P)-dependent oxidoreductase [Bacteroidales bacterium]|nr:SDR family NAD(P)-dependent oxidoreductase [Bacteroidales bacterium]
MDKPTKNEYALVTGGSSGIGYAYAEGLAKRGYNILIVSNREDLNEQSREKLQAKYPQLDIAILMMDLAQPDAGKQLYDYCHQQKMEIEVLVNNAGMFYFGAAVEKAPAITDTMLRLHVTTPTDLCVLFGKEMKDKGHGYILNAGSIAGFMSFPTIAAYESSKSYIVKFTRALAFELSHYGVKVCCVCPGAVDTDLYNLSLNLRKWLCRIGVMLKPHQVANRGLRAMFRGRKRKIPGWINYFFLFCCFLLPGFIINIVKKKFV